MQPQPPLRRVTVSPLASAKWRMLPAGIPRNIRVAAQQTMHSDAPKAYARFRKIRIPGREDFACRYEIVLADDQQSCSHLFALDFDDAQSSDELSLLDVTYTRFDAE